MKTGHRVLLAMVVAASCVAASAKPVSNCFCWKEYEPEKVPGGYQCVSKVVYHAMACNIPQPPECVCTGHNGILNDRTGTWCTVYMDGREFERWSCENSRDWDLFFEKYGSS